MSFGGRRIGAEHHRGDQENAVRPDPAGQEAGRVVGQNADSGGQTGTGAAAPAGTDIQGPEFDCPAGYAEDVQVIPQTFRQGSTGVPGPVRGVEYENGATAVDGGRFEIHSFFSVVCYNTGDEGKRHR